MAPSPSKSPSMSPIVRRAPVTYGRRRTPSNADTSTSLDTSATPGTISSRASPYGATLSEPENDFPPSSDGLDTLDSSLITKTGDDDASDEENMPPYAGFSWKKELAEVDRIYDLEETVLHRDDAREGSAQPSSPHLTPDPFVPPRGSRSPSTDQENVGIAETTRSSSASPVGPRRVRRRVVTHDSDTEPEPSLGLSSPNTSPHNLHHIGTPQSRSSPTPPTSLDMAPSRGKGKGKQRAVEPLLLEEELPSVSAEKKRATGKPKKVKGKGKETRTKAPTKKERQETQKATARIVADQLVSIPRVQGKAIPLTALFETIGRRITPDVHKSPVQSSDPIQQFSSPAGAGIFAESAAAAPSPTARAKVYDGSPVRHSSDAFVANGLLGDVAADTTLPDAAASSDEEEMPNVITLIDQVHKKRLDQGLYKQAMELKQRALLQVQHEQSDADEEDDSDLEVVQGDMQIVAKEEAQNRRAMHARNIKPSAGRKNQLAHAGPLRGSGAGSHKKTIDRAGADTSLHILQAAATPSFSWHPKEARDQGPKMNRKKLDEFLLHGIQKQAQEEQTRKEEEWVRRGGKLKLRPEDVDQDEPPKNHLLTVISKGLSASRQEDGGYDEESDEGHDGDYRPDERGSGSDDEEDTQPQVYDVPGDQPEDEDDTSDQENVDMPRPRRGAHYRRLFPSIQSDEENDENFPRHPQLSGNILVPGTSPVGRHASPRRESAISMVTNRRNSLSSQDERMEDGTDKENDARLMFDQGEDKENTAVLARSPTLRPLSLRPMLMDQDDDEWEPRGNPFADRTPLKELRRDDEDADPFAFSGQSRRIARRQLESLSGDTPLRPAFVSETNTPLGLDVERGPRSAAASPLAMPPPPLKAGGLSQFFTQETAGPSGLDKLRGLGDADGLSLTLDVGLQPALEVSGSLLRKADSIFEKEQEYLADEAIRNPAKKPQLYVNENGFLTQTRPDVSTPEVYRIKTPSQFGRLTNMTPSSSVPRTLQRRPLGPIDLEEVPETPEVPRRRLKKREVSPAESEKSDQSSSSPSHTPSKAKTGKAPLPWSVFGQVKPVKKLEKSVFIEGEAEESDDDAMVGFGGPKRDDGEEENGEDQDRTLAELVDDAVMDEDTLAAGAVLEKVQEHLQMDDAKLEKIHRDAVEGKLRVKRRDRGIGFEDSDSETDDEDAKRLRRGIVSKKRKIDGDSLEQLAKHQETLPFVEAYQEILDDDDDFAHLQNDELTLADDQEEDIDGPREEVSIAAVREELRDMSRGDAMHQVFNPDDLSWLEEDNEDESTYHVREIDSKKIGARQSADWDGDRPHANDELDDARLRKWASGESSSRMAGFGRSNRVSAVTGHGKRKTGNGSIGGAQRAGGLSSKAQQAESTVARTASTLSAVLESRRSKFGN
ncbi:MRC1-like domain-containing protein [Amylocystis lapponica]|nr:MRC1-like domain-containing protein [Amylocystis lapponica]